MEARNDIPSLNILIVDDHEILREGLLRILGEADPHWRATAVGNGFDALNALRRMSFDVAIIDLSMPGMGGLDLIQRMHAEHPGVATLVLSMFAQEQYALRAFKAGARGYVTKEAAGRELVRAVRKVAVGGAYVPSNLAENFFLQLRTDAATPPHDKLSNRELEVVRRLVAGERLTDIAEALHLSVKTVSSHKGRILSKLQLPSLAALVRYGMQQGLVDEVPLGAGVAPDTGG